MGRTTEAADTAIKTPSITEATGLADIETARQLFLAYAASLPISLDFQGFDAELAGLPGKYAPPGGTILLARAGEQSPADGQPMPDARPAGCVAAGCVAVRPLKPAGVCEMKRLYVLPEYRKLHLGRALAKAAITWADDAGYHAMRLDTLPSMTTAVALYKSLGFADIAPYCANPHAGTRFLELMLRHAPR